MDIIKFIQDLYIEKYKTLVRGQRGTEQMERYYIHGLEDNIDNVSFLPNLITIQQK